MPLSSEYLVLSWRKIHEEKTYLLNLRKGSEKKLDQEIKKVTKYSANKKEIVSYHQNTLLVFKY